MWWFESEVQLSVITHMQVHNELASGAEKCKIYTLEEKRKSRNGIAKSCAKKRAVTVKGINTGKERPPAVKQRMPV